MKTLTQQDIKKALIKLGLKKGDVVLVHSDISRLGMIKGVKSRQDYLKTLYKIFQEVIGKTGTLAVPAFFYEYGRWQTPYDIKRSPVSGEAGVFSQFVAGLPGAKRSLNPIAAVAAIGPKDREICNQNTTSDYDIDSAWDRLMKLNAKMVFLGIDLRAMTFNHYVEYMVGVPHVYNKLYKIPVKKAGKKIKDSICAQVRFLDFDVVYDTEGNTPKFEKAGIVKKAKLGNGIIRLIACQEAFEFLKKKLNKDYYYLLKNPPKFRAGIVPTDGGSGKSRK